jgi:phosphoribosylanthranilate isomerase
VFVKICGMTTPEAVAAAADAGADAVGFVFARSPREVTPERALELCAALPDGMLRVAVMHHPDRDTVDSVLATFAPDWLQTDAEDLDGIELPDSCQPLPVFRNGAVPRPGAIGPRILFEGAQSGTGETADWEEARRLALATELILAGGLDPDNVEAAIRYVAPWGVDVSSGVEKRRGVKDPAKIRRFVGCIRAMEITQ